MFCLTARQILRRDVLLCARGSIGRLHTQRRGRATVTRCERSPHTDRFSTVLIAQRSHFQRKEQGVLPAHQDYPCSPSSHPSAVRSGLVLSPALIEITRRRSQPGPLQQSPSGRRCAWMRHATPARAGSYTGTSMNADTFEPCGLLASTMHLGRVVRFTWVHNCWTLTTTSPDQPAHHARPLIVLSYRSSVAQRPPQPSALSPHRSRSQTS